MSDIHPFLFLVIAEFAVFVAVLAGVSLWSAGGAATPVARPARAVTPARSPAGAPTLAH
jgi:hypothetical protein